MSLSAEALEELHHTACLAATKAGELIQQLAQSSFEVKHKDQGSTIASQVVTEVDYKSEKLIIEQLAPSISKYDLALLTEEQPDDHSRLAKDYFWCIDPLDGTLAFTESCPGYAVSIALVDQSGCALIGAVFNPLTNTLYSACRGKGAFRNGQSWMPSVSVSKKTVTLPLDRSFTARPDFDAIIKAIEVAMKNIGFEGLELIHKQGAVMNALSVLEHLPGLYFKLPKKEQGGGSFWDFAATACIYQELGFHVSEFNGAPLKLNKPETSFMNHCGVFYAENKALHQAVTSLKEICL